jgi:hypothetical protein
LTFTAFVDDDIAGKLCCKIMNSYSPVWAVLALCMVLFSRTCSAQCIVTFAGPVDVAGAPSKALQLSSPFGIASDTAGGFYFSETNIHVVRHVFNNATMVTSVGFNRRCSQSGDSGPGKEFSLCSPAHLSSDRNGGVLIVDRSNNALRRLFSNGSVVTLAGTGTSGTTGGSNVFPAVDSGDPAHCHGSFVQVTVVLRVWES